MKRIPVFLLSVFLVLSVFAVSLAESIPDSFVQHEIWSIPWGIPLDEFLALSREKLGVTFVPIQEPDYFGNIAYQAEPSQSITVLGHPASVINTYFSKEAKRLVSFFIVFDYVDIMPDSSYTLPMYLNLWNQFIFLYGKPTDLYVSPFTLEPYDYQIPTEFPLKDDQFDMARYLEILEEYQGISFTIDAIFNNVSLGHSVSQRGDSSHYFISIIAKYYGIEGSAPFPELSGNDITFSPITIHLGL